MEEQALYDQFVAGEAFEGQFSETCASPFASGAARGLASSHTGIDVTELMKTRVPVLYCPSDDEANQLFDQMLQWVNCEVAATSYKGVMGDPWLGGGDTANNISDFNNDDTELPSGLYDRDPAGNSIPSDVIPTNDKTRDCHRGVRCRGIMFRHTWLRPVKIAQITDGTSKTLMIGEDIPSQNRSSVAFYANGALASCNNPINLTAQTLGVTEQAFLNNWGNSVGFKSFHPGGAQFCRADGSVVFVSETIDNVSYRVSCTRNGGEVARDEL